MFCSVISFLRSPSLSSLSCHTRKTLSTFSIRLTIVCIVFHLLPCCNAYQTESIEHSTCKRAVDLFEHSKSNNTTASNRNQRSLLIDQNDYKLYTYFASDSNFDFSSASVARSGASDNFWLRSFMLNTAKSKLDGESERQQLSIALSVWRSLLLFRSGRASRLDSTNEFDDLVDVELANTTDTSKDARESRRAGTAAALERISARIAHNAVTRLTNGVQMAEFWQSARDAVVSRLTCTVCHVLSTLYTSMRLSTQTVISLSKRLCRSTAGTSSSVCDSLVDSYSSTMAFIRSHTKLHRAELCGVLIGSQCAPHPAERLLGWHVQLPALINRNYMNSNSAYRSDSGRSRNESKSQSDQRDSFWVAQITDLHLDPHYRAFIRSKCVLPVCCRQTALQHERLPTVDSGGLLVSNWNMNNMTGDTLRNSSIYKMRSLLDGGSFSGIWGDYNSCDTPSSTFAAILQQLRRMQDDGFRVTSNRVTIKGEQKFRYVMWTGDLPAHDIWNYNRPSTVQNLQDINREIQRMLPNVPVFPVLGNHETVPINSFAPDFQDPTGAAYDLIEQFEFDDRTGQVRQVASRRSEVSFDANSSNDNGAHRHSFLWTLGSGWLYEAAARAWAKWLPESALAQVRRSGNYAVDVDSRLRIIVINSNYCARMNPWTLYDPVDPGNQLKFLTRELYLAENRNQRVHLLGHIAPDHRECTQAWLENFVRILMRFQHVIAAQYYGHTHRDEFRVYYVDADRAERFYRKYGMRNQSGLDDLLDYNRVPVSTFLKTEQATKNYFWSNWWPWRSSTSAAISSTRKPAQPLSDRLRSNLTEVKVQQLVGFSLIAPSITSYSQTNPAFRMYQIHRSRGDLLEYKTIFFNLTDSNLRLLDRVEKSQSSSGPAFLSAQQQRKVAWPKWAVEYSAVKTYHDLLASIRNYRLSAKDSADWSEQSIHPVNEHLHHLILQEMHVNRTFLSAYNRRYFVNADTAQSRQPMSKEARLSLLQDHRVYDPIHTRPFDLILS